MMYNGHATSIDSDIGMMWNQKSSISINTHNVTDG